MRSSLGFATWCGVGSTDWAGYSLRPTGAVPDADAVPDDGSILTFEEAGGGAEPPFFPPSAHPQLFVSGGFDPPATSTFPHLWRLSSGDDARGSTSPLSPIPYHEPTVQEIVDIMRRAEGLVTEGQISQALSLLREFEASLVYVGPEVMREHTKLLDQIQILMRSLGQDFHSAYGERRYEMILQMMWVSLLKENIEGTFLNLLLKNQLSNAEAFIVSALKDTQQAFGDASVQACQVKYLLIRVLFELQRYEECMRVISEIENFYERIGKRDAKEFLQARVSRGNVLGERGNLSQAIELFTGILEKYGAQETRHHYELLRAARGIAICLMKQENLEKAKKYWAEALNLTTVYFRRDYGMVFMLILT